MPTFSRPVQAALLLICLAFAAVNLDWVMDGVRAGGDTPRYVQGGDALFGGEELTGRQLLYLGYVAVVGFFETGGLGQSALMLFQVAVSALATAAVFALARRLAGDWAGVGAAALMATNRDIAQWNAFVLPDSLYISAVPIVIWLADRAVGRNWRGYAPAVAMLVVASTLRPNGWILALLVLTYWLLRADLRARVRIAAIAGTFALVLALVAAGPSQEDTTETLQPAELLRAGVVVYDHPGSNLSVADDDSRSKGWAGVTSYAADHPVDTTRVLAARAVTEILHTRKFYTARHNRVIMVTLLPAYFFAIWGFVVCRRRPLTILIAAVIAAHLALVAIVAADYDGRYLLHFLPLIYVMSGAGLWDAYSRTARRARARSA
ncbi:MAG: glycosyltransferase family 39 protein [Thermoleophilaceae bacterium]|nr:glycosyltransferase family 39 protein [Thermoleophilaceae bacterium]